MKKDLDMHHVKDGETLMVVMESLYDNKQLRDETFHMRFYRPSGRAEKGWASHGVWITRTS